MTLVFLGHAFMFIVGVFFALACSELYFWLNNNDNEDGTF